MVSERLPGRRHGVLGLLAMVTMLFALVMALLVAPPDAEQGQVQRLMYVHVPAAWTGFLAFAVVLIASVRYLISRDLRWDRRAQAAAEVGVGMTALAIVLGSIWGRATWGVWWTWDARLVTTTVLLLIYVGYLGVRGLGGDAAAGARRAAVLGVVGFIDVPVVHLSVVWWRTLHQPPTLLAPSTAPPIAPVMGLALLAGVAAFTLTAAWVYRRRVSILDARVTLAVVAPTPPLPAPIVVVAGAAGRAQ